MGVSSSSVEKRGLDGTVDSESRVKKTRIQEVMIAQTQTEIEATEDASEQRFVWTPDGYVDEAQLQAGVQQGTSCHEKVCCVR